MYKPTMDTLGWLTQQEANVRAGVAAARHVGSLAGGAYNYLAGGSGGGPVRGGGRTRQWTQPYVTKMPYRSGGLVRGLPYKVGKFGKVITDLKYDDFQSQEFSLNSTALAGTNGIVELPLMGATTFTIPEGTGVGNRDGRAISIMSLQLKFRSHLIGIDTGSDLNRSSTNAVRIMVVQDTQANGTVAGIEDVLDFTGASDSQDRFQSFWNLKQGGRFISLVDKQVNLTTNTESASLGIQGDIRRTSIYKKLKMPIMYNGTAGLVTEVTSNQLLVFLIPFNLSSDAFQYPVVNVSGRIRYTG